ncbi:MAG: 2OG-Fe(II) oxygenase [Acidimicrobiales bacterium]
MSVLTILAGDTLEVDRALDAGAPDDLVLVIEAYEARVFGDGDDFVAALEQRAADVFAAPAPGRGWFGRRHAVVAARTASGPGANESEIFLTLDGTGTDAIVLGGGVVAAATGASPLVVLGSHADVEELDRSLATDQSGDLARVLAYDGSLAASPLVTEADELLSTAFWTPEMCRAVVRAAEATGAWASDPDDPVPGREVSLAAISPVLFANLEGHVRQLVVPMLRSHWPTIADAGVHDAFVIKYAAGSGRADLPLHHDVAQISGSVRLNEGYEGGVLEFPRQGFSNEKMAIGTLLVWPSLVTHPHRSSPVTRGVKYALTVWFRLPGS